MKMDFRPILVVPAVPHEGGIRFLHRKTQIDIGPEMAKMVWEVLSYANGYNSISDIAKLVQMSENEVQEVFFELSELELVVDAREQFMHFHRVSNYPATFNTTLTQDEIEAYTKSKRVAVKSGVKIAFKCDTGSALYQMRKKRRSCRNFAEQKLTVNQIGSICHYAYSIPDHSVPSGGALYPLKIYVLVERAQDDIGVGYYEYDAEHNNLICFSDEVDEEQLKYCFNQEVMPFGSSVQIVIAADLRRQPHKYANRGYRLTLIEVGHVAENISLYCAEQGFGACEMGGVLDEPLKKELGLEEDVWPIVTIPVGYPANSETETFNKIRYVEENVGKENAVKEIWVKEFDDDGAFFGATTAYMAANGKIQFAGAMSTSYADAVFKATIEGYERWLSGQVRVDFHGPAKAIQKRWLDPRLIFPLTKEQCEKEGVKTFSTNLPLDWTLGTLFDGTEVYIPSDIVYYGQKSGENRIYFGHSSGIAAYSNYDEAKKRALTELIERDAIMRNWYEQSCPNIIYDDLLPIHVKKRAQHWREQNRKLTILQMPSDYGWVFEAVITSDEYPCLIVGAAATIERDAIEEAILKALMEAEYNLLLTLKDPDAAEILPEEVVTPTDHGKFYYTLANAKKLDWLIGGKVNTMFAEPKYIGLDELMQILKVSFVDLSQADSMIKVVRAFSPDLVPINFGFHTAHFTHPVLRGRIHPDSIMMPHYFA